MRYFLLALVLISCNVFAQWSNTSGEVTDIYSNNGSIFLMTTITDGPCPAAGKFWWLITDPDSSIMMSLALTAFSTGNKIQVVYDQANPQCSYAGAAITHMRLHK